MKYPRQAMWPLAWIRQSQDQDRKRIGSEIFHSAVKTLKEKHATKNYNVLRTSTVLLDYLYQIAIASSNQGARYRVNPLSREVDLSDFVPPIQSALSISLTSGDSGRTRDAFPRYIPRMIEIDPDVQVMSSKARPKKIRIRMVGPEDAPLFAPTQAPRDKEIGELHFLLKQEIRGDLRKDARVQDLSSVVNRILASSTRDKGESMKKLRLQTFTVTCLSESTGLVEWIPQTTPLRRCISDAVNEFADKDGDQKGGRDIVDLRNPNFRTEMESLQDMYASGNKTEAREAYIRFQRKYPPVLFWWFIANFKNPHVWYEARTRFTMSAVAWSAIGHIIGLGDRHTENILVKENSGDCVHVDFDCIFDKGLDLPKPELVPFRLTQNMIDAFGPSGANGVFSRQLETAMGVMRKNQGTILAILEPFLTDPVINWKKSRGQQRRLEKNSVLETKRQMAVIEQRLQGHYNVRVPKHRLVGQKQRVQLRDSENTLDHHTTIPLSVEGQAHKMITEATDPENLLRLYYGWLPWA